MSREIQLQKELVEAIQNAYLESKFYEVKQNCDALKQLGELPSYILKIIDKAENAINKAEVSLKQAETFLFEGYPQKALQAYEDSKKIVKDHPGIEEGVKKCNEQLAEAKECLEKIKEAVEAKQFDIGLELKKELESLDRDLVPEATQLLQDYKLIKKEKRKRTILFGLVGGVVVMGLVVVMASYLSSLQKSSDKNAYSHLVEMVRKEPNPRKMLAYYKTFLANHPKSQYLPQIRAKLRELPKIIDEKDYKDAIAAEKKAGDDLDKARITFEGYLKKHPRGRHKGDVKKALQKLSERIDERSYQQTLSACEKAGENYEECQGYLKKYMEKYPEGRYREEVQERLAGIPDLIFQRTLKEVEAYRAKGDWKSCLIAVEKCLDKYGDNPKKKQKLETIRNQCFDAIDRQDFETANNQAEEAGTKLDGIEKAYQNYLNQHPEGKFANLAREALQNVEAKRIELKKRKARMVAQQEDDNTWESIKKQATQSKMIPRSEQIIITYLRKYPHGRHIKEAKKEIVELEKKWFRKHAPILDRLKSKIVMVKGGNKLEGVTEFDGNYYYVKGKSSSYVLSKTNVIAVEPSEESRKAAEYNKLLKQVNINRSSSLKKLARWSTRHGFSDKAFLCYRLAAYLNPQDGELQKTMHSHGYTYKKGVWTK